MTILDDHVADFEYVAVDRADPGLIDPPAGAIDGLTYEEGQSYLEALVGDDVMRDDTTRIVGERVGDQIYAAAATGDTLHATRAGALSEMSVLATAEADLDSAKAEDAMNGFAKTAAGQIVGLTPPGKIPGFGVIADQGSGRSSPRTPCRARSRHRRRHRWTRSRASSACRSRPRSSSVSSRRRRCRPCTPTER